MPAPQRAGSAGRGGGDDAAVARYEPVETWWACNASHDTVADAPGGSGCVLDARLDWANRVIIVRGELDLAATARLTEVMAILIDHDPGDSTVEISGVSFIDASCLGRLVALRNQLTARGATVRVVGARAGPRRIFQLAGLGELLADTPGPRTA